MNGSCYAARKEWLAALIRGAISTADWFGDWDSHMRISQSEPATILPPALSAAMVVDAHKNDGKRYIVHSDELLGTVGTQRATFIAGIRGATTANANAVPVVIDSAGQLGTVSSSVRFKTDIQPMDKTSETILGLKPVTFHYKSDTEATPQFGLIVEEVARVNPNLVVRDENGEIYTVRYEAVNAMLLNEFLKEQRKVEEQGATIAQMKKQIDALAATVQKVSEQIEMNEPARCLVTNP
jgi:hypothetical protein